MSLTLGLNTAISGLLTSQKGLDVVSQNIANINTEGYSRKIFNPESRVLAGYGAGVQVAEITRRVEEGLRADLREAKSLYSQLDTADTYYSRVQDLFGKPSDNTSIAHRVNALGEELEMLGLEGHKAAQSDQVLQVAGGLAQQFNSLTQQVQQLRANADAEISAYTQQVNAHLKDIQDLNEKITLARATGRGTADLEDKRDVALNKLSELIDVNYYQRENGAVNVFTKAGVSLVDNEARELDHGAVTSANAWDSHAAGDFSGISVDGQDITNDIRSGKVKALIDMRDGELPNLQAQLDELAESLRETLNQAHNRGSNFPTMDYDLEGTRTFIPDGGGNYTQTMTLQSGDVAISLFDGEGAQSATTTLDTIMQTAGHPAGGPWTIDDVASEMQSWLNGPGGLTGAVVEVNSTGKFDLNLGTSSQTIQFRDQASSTPGAETGDVTIGFDADGNGTIDETASGFSNFLGLNDMFEKGRNEWLWDSKTLPGDYTSLGSTTLGFSTTSDGHNFTSVLVNHGDSLQDIADSINNNAALDGKVRATVVPDGNGQRLRIRNLNGEDMAVTQVGGSATAFENLGLDQSNAGEAGSLHVSERLQLNPDRLNRGQVQYNSDTGEYYLSAGDNSVANQMAEAFTQTRSYDTAGGLSTGKLKLGDYAASIVSGASSRAANTESDLSYQKGLTESLDMKDAEISEVNLDEELSQLMIFEQSYAAAAKVISTTRQMFDTLNSII